MSLEMTLAEVSFRSPLWPPSARRLRVSCAVGRKRLRTLPLSVEPTRVARAPNRRAGFDIGTRLRRGPSYARSRQMVLPRRGRPCAYSLRSVSAGSSRAAFRAGRYPALRATATKMIVAAATVGGSVGESSNRNDPITRLTPR